MEEFVNRYRKELTWLLYALATVAILLFLQAQLYDKKAARIVQTLISGILVGGIMDWSPWASWSSTRRRVFSISRMAG